MPIPKRLLVGSRRDYPLEVLFSQVELGRAREDLGERQLLNLALPTWQRPEAWDESRKRAFVEGLFLGFGAGQYVVNGGDWQWGANPSPFSGWLLDGQQRIRAIKEFVEGAFTVFGDVRYPGMEKADQLRFMRTPFPCFELEYTDDEQLLKELYNRLNFGGVAHTPEQRAI